MLGVINTGNINATLRRNISYHIDAAGAMLQITGDHPLSLPHLMDPRTRVPFVVFLTVINSALLSYFAGVVCAIFASRTGRGYWPMMLFHAMIFADVSMKLCFW